MLGSKSIVDTTVIIPMHFNGENMYARISKNIKH